MQELTQQGAHPSLISAAIHLRIDVENAKLPMDRLWWVGTYRALGGGETDNHASQSESVCLGE